MSSGVEDDNIIHADGSVDPIRDKEDIDTELRLKDLETVETRMQKVAKQASIGDKDARKQLDLYERVKSALEQGLSARAVEREDSEEALFQEMQLLTGKPILYVCNVEEGAVVDGNAHVERVKEMAASEGAGTLIIGAAIEADIAELEDQEERDMFLADLGLQEPGVAKLIRSAYSLLKLRWLHGGEKEVRARPARAAPPQAAGVIHTDFEKGSIRRGQSMTTSSSWGASRRSRRPASSASRKEYIVQDGDIMHPLNV